METIIVTSDNRDTIIDSVTKEMNGYTLRIYRQQYVENGHVYNKATVEFPYVKGDFNIEIYDKPLKDGIEMRIQTTSYGALTTSEMSKLLDKYQKAMEVCTYVNQIKWDEVPILMFKN